MGRQTVEGTRCLLNDGDVAAFNSTWQNLLTRVHRRFFYLDRTQIEDAISDAFVRLLTQSNKEDAGAYQREVELSVQWLYTESCRRVGDRVRAERRRRHREGEYVRRAKNLIEEDFLVQDGLLAASISLEERHYELERLLERCTSWERAFVLLRNQGIKDLTVYAEALGVIQDSVIEQRRQVNLAWNRLRKKLQRWAMQKKSE